MIHLNENIFDIEILVKSNPSFKSNYISKLALILELHFNFLIKSNYSFK